MLENRPIVRNTLCGIAAFGFVFAAAMGGTAFMITGGFGWGHDAQASAPRAETARYIVLTPSAWASEPRNSYDVTPTSAPMVEEAALEPAYFEPAADLEGAPRQDAYYGAQTEDQVRAQIERDYYADAYGEETAYADPEPADDYAYSDPKKEAGVY
ncbi:MAG: hypothetical protein WDM79_08655 [Terricaulis sp.]